ncbi:unnamed protein product [Spirodela intermedia]|uniref:F-box domain-containing protein n=1 Tax=Spirodela intermedia TaxID=51605 RepID=A0A7I8LHP2_SPIIN|nr:unnamed protein product [Spirodela intermedia]
MEAAPPERRGAGGEVEEEEAEEDGEKKRGGGFGQWKDQAELPPALRPSTDVITRVFSQLDCVDLLHCSLVCKQWYRDSAELREGWKNEYLEALKFYGMGIKRETHPPSSTFYKRCA